jgi:hypothetical protein
LLDLKHVTFVSDCVQLLAFLKSQDHSNPPNWRMKIHTQLFDDATLNRMPQVIKIDRNLNSTSHALATLDFSSPDVLSCSYEHLDHQCLLLDAAPMSTLIISVYFWMHWPLYPLFTQEF